jgi:hypothetical protein
VEENAIRRLKHQSWTRTIEQLFVGAAARTIMIELLPICCTLRNPRATIMQAQKKKRVNIATKVFTFRVTVS